MRLSLGKFALIPVAAVALSAFGCQQAGQMGSGLMAAINPNAAPTAGPTPAAFTSVQTPPPANPSPTLQNVLGGPPRQQPVPVQPAITNGPAPAANGPLGPCPTSRKGAREPLSSGEFRAYCRGFEGVACKQKTEVWCWAAGIQMIYKFAGKDMTQEVIVERVNKVAPGNDPDSSLTVRGALEQEVMQAMCPDEYNRMMNPQNTILSGVKDNMTSGHMAMPGIKLNGMSGLRGLKDMALFDATDMVQSISSGAPVLLSLRHKDDPTEAHMYTVYSVSYKPTLDVAGSIINGAMTGSSKSAMANGPRPGYILGEIKAINPWTGKSETFQVSEIQPRVAYMLSEPSVKRAYDEMSNIVQVKK
jgi:hypothetical protein